MIWSSSSGRLELVITKDQATQCSHPGPCDADVLAVSHLPKVGQQLRRIDPTLLRNELREYGVWGELELNDHEQNLQRVLWIACNDITEEVGA